MTGGPLVAHLPGATVARVALGSTALAVETAGLGDRPPVLLVHGFPHTRAIWRAVVPALTGAGLGVIAPDLRGLGDSDPAADGFGAEQGATDLRELLDALGVARAHVVALDLGVAPAFGLAAWAPERVASLTLVEGMVGDLPGAERLLAGGGPWWFGFHQAPGGLAEDVVAGAEERYVRFFLGIGSQAGLPNDLAATIARAYSDHDRLAAAFGHYRAMPDDAAAIRAWAEGGRLAMPVLTVGAAPVAESTAHQLRPFAPQLEHLQLDGSGHIVPVDAPDRLADAILARASG